MGIFIKQAWRNLRRNKRRTIITGLALGLGLTALILYDALLIGMKESMVQTATSSFIGQAQIHAQDFRSTQELEKTINNVDEVCQNLSEEEIIESYSMRVTNFAMLASPRNNTSVNLYGIDPKRELELSKIDDVIQEGDYFSGDTDREIVIGSELAELLDVDLGDRLVITVSQAFTGDLSQEMFRVSGIYRFGDRTLDGGMAFIRLPVAQRIFHLDGSAHEIAIKFTNIAYAEMDSLSFWDKYSQNGNEALSWTVLFPQLKSAFDLSETARYIVGLILFAIVALACINTLFMSLYERMFEFGVLKAVGTRPYKIGLLIFYEAFFISIISVIIGSVLSMIIGGLLGHYGIDYRGLEYLGTTVQELIYPTLTIRQFIEYPIYLIILTTLIGLYPSIHAAKLNPSEAMRKSL